MGFVEGASALVLPPWSAFRTVRLTLDEGGVMSVKSRDARVVVERQFCRVRRQFFDATSTPRRTMSRFSVEDLDRVSLAIDERCWLIDCSSPPA